MINTIKIINIQTMTESGGAQKRAIHLATNLRERGFLCETWFLFKRLATFDTFPYVKILYKKEPSIFLYPFIFVSLVINLLKYHPNVIIAFGESSNSFGLLAALFAHIRFRIAMQISVSSRPQYLTRLLDKLLGCTPVYHKIISVSEDTLKSYSKYPKMYLNKCLVINSGTDKPSRKLVPKFRWNNHTKLIGSVGRLTKIKNHELVIRSLKYLPTNYSYVIAGDGELKQYLIDLARELEVQNRLKLIGEISSDDVWDFMESIDIFAFPSLTEAFSLTLVQAALCRKSIITINIPIVYGILGYNACNVSLGTSQDFSNTLLHISNKIDKAYEVALTYSAKNMVDKYQKLIEYGMMKNF